MSWLSKLFGGGRRGRAIKPGEQYVSSFGGFRCGPFQLPTVAEDAFGPHGGTVQLIDEVTRMRVDVEEFEPPMDAAELAQMRETLLQGYLSESTLPLVRSGVPSATLLGSRMTTIKGREVLQSAIRMPGTGGAVTPEGKRVDGIRGQVQLTNGRFIYTVSKIAIAWPNGDPEKQLQNAYLTAQNAFELCDFPA